ncbi:MAG: hypothetical protein JXB04_09630, partial [Kiritimatiellae bacterium]|nr:hypothetical protein [Kiritimatiellia bacterium]
MTSRSRLLALACVFVCSAFLIPAAFGQTTHYVSPSGGNVAPYTTWANAARVIQDAVDVAGGGDLVLVSNGVYNTGGRATPGYALLTRVVITNSVVVQSVNGPEVTFIVGQGPIGPGAVRCAYLEGGATLAGFTVTNGHTDIRSGSPSGDNSGGGVFALGACVVSNCIITGCGTEYVGGGLYGIWGAGFVVDCLIQGNWSDFGGGGVRLSDAIGFTLERCAIVDNWARLAGAGIHLYHAGIVNNCLIARNRADVDSGGGAYVDWGTYYGAGNTAFNNCTITANSAPANGGLSYVINGAEVRNSIVCNNENGNWAGGNYTYCCTTPLPAGTGNITNDPQFVNFAEGDYHLTADSPCVDAGNNAYVSWSEDLDGNQRIGDGVVDMGVYEIPGAPPPSEYWITQIGFSNDPEGDQDVTEFLNDETLHIYV